MAEILVVDDSRSIRELTRQVLGSAGHEVVEAENGAVGFECAQARSFDLILTDLNMPVLNGLDMTRQIRSLRNHRKTPLLLVTTESQLSRKEEAKAAGATGWIVKPIPPQRLLQVVETVLQTAVGA
jgi:two-component system chemotaxis response regulator CheY